MGLEPLIPRATDGFQIDWSLLLSGLVLAVVCGFAARLFSIGTNAARSWRKRTSPIRSALIGSLLLVAIAYLGWLAASRWVTFGPGHVMFLWATQEPRAFHLLLFILVIHAMASMVCVFGGGGGGVFTSLAATGALLGCIADLLLDSPTSDYFLPLVGAACLLGSAYRIPIAGTLMIVEWGGGIESIVFGAIFVLIAWLCVGSTTIAPAQSERFAPAGSDPTTG